MITFLGDRFLTKLYYKARLASRFDREGLRTCLHPLLIPGFTSGDLDLSILENSSIIILFFHPSRMLTLREPSKFIATLSSLFEVLISLQNKNIKIFYVSPLLGKNQHLTPLHFAIKDVCKHFGILYIVSPFTKTNQRFIFHFNTALVRRLAEFLITFCVQFSLHPEVESLSLSHQ